MSPMACDDLVWGHSPSSSSLPYTYFKSSCMSAHLSFGGSRDVAASMHSSAPFRSPSSASKIALPEYAAISPGSISAARS